MVTDNLLEFLNDFQKFALKVKIQQILDSMVKDDRVHEVIDADTVFDYYNKMHEHFTKNPREFLFPNREWVQESLKRLNVNVSEIFDEDANVNHIKREEIIILFMLLWIHMVVRNPIRAEVIKDPYDLFYIWTKNRVFIARPTETHYLQDGDRQALDRLGKSYGWFTGVHHFTIGVKGAVEYHYSSPDDITNIDGAYNKAHGNDLIEEKQRRHRIARNTKFIVRKMTDISNKDYKLFLKNFKEKEEMRYDELSQCFEDILKISGLELDHEVVLEVTNQYNCSVYRLNKALLKLKEKLNNENA